MACLHQPGQRAHAPAQSGGARRRLVSRTLEMTTDLRRLTKVFPGTQVIGPDPMVETFERLFRLSDHGLAILRIRYSSRPLTVIGVSAHAWHCPATRASLFGLKRACTRVGRRIVLIPPGVLQRQPRLDCARWVASCAGVRTTAAERNAVLIEVKTAATPSLSSAAAVLKRTDATSAVLSLVAQGLLEIDLAQPIGPHSRLKQAAPASPSPTLSNPSPSSHHLQKPPSIDRTSPSASTLL